MRANRENKGNSMADRASHWRCLIGECRRGSVVVERFSVSDDDSRWSSVRRNYVPAGRYTRLLINGKLVMSDTPKEMSDHWDLFRAASGHVLLNGLGLGCCLNVVRHAAEVTGVTVIEKNADVIGLVASRFPGVEIIHGDALTWQPPKGKRYGAVWHDIWSDICEDNLAQMHALHRKYGRRTDWQGSWSRGQIEAARRRRVRW